MINIIIHLCPILFGYLAVAQLTLIFTHRFLGYVSRKTATYIARTVSLAAFTALVIFPWGISFLDFVPTLILAALNIILAWVAWGLLEVNGVREDKTYQFFFYGKKTISPKACYLQGYIYEDGHCFTTALPCRPDELKSYILKARRNKLYVKLANRRYSKNDDLIEVKAVK